MNGASESRDKDHRSFLESALARAADQLRVRRGDRPTFGWLDRTIGVRAIRADDTYWLRVVAEEPQWADGDWWDGNAAAGEIAGISKPRVVAVVEWDADGFRLRAELMTFVPTTICSPTPEARVAPDLPDKWWNELDLSLDRLSRHRTERVCVDQQFLSERLASLGGAIDPVVTEWTTAHGDLHWNNLGGPELVILDWEGWGRAPAGLDAATLYCHSLLVPAVSQRVRARYADLLDSPDGVRSQLYVVARMLHHIDNAGDHLDLEGPLRHYACLLMGS